MLQRLLFFVRSSALLSMVLVLAIGGVVAGWAVLSGTHQATGIVLLVSSSVALHAVLLAPLQGADETSQAGTIEWLIWNPPELRTWAYPASLARVAEALDQDRVQFHPSEPLPLAASSGDRLRDLLRSDLADEAREPASFPPASSLQVANEKGPLFFGSFAALGGGLRALSMIDRLAAYRLLATASSLLLFGSGLALLRWAHQPRQTRLLYGVLFLVPNLVAVVASCSNYSVAIGMGFLIGAGVLTSVLSADRRRRLVGASAAIVAAWLGVALWPDFVGLAILMTAAVAAALLLDASRSHSGRRRPLRALVWTALVLLPFLALAGISLYFAAGRLPDFDPRLHGVLSGLDNRHAFHLLVLTIAPGAIAALLAVLRYARYRVPSERRVRAARRTSFAVAAFLLAMFLATPHTEVPYERVFLALPDLVRAHLDSFWSNNFSWDQDRLGWKLWFGAFGWHDTFYPDAVYAMARWAAVALLICLPVLTVDFAVRRPAQAAVLLLVSGATLSLAMISQLVRHAMSIHPQGRFFLPYLALAALPVLVQIEKRGRERVFELLLRVAVALQVWTAIFVLGERYLLPG